MVEYRLVSLLLMRVKNLAAWSDSLPEGVVAERLAQVRSRFGDEVHRHRGELQDDSLGRYPDSFLALFNGPSDALAAALTTLAAFDSGVPGLPAGCVEAGCAVNSGEIFFRSGSIMGSALEVVSKLEYRAEPGQILFTESVLLSIGNERDLSYHPLLRKIGGDPGPEMRTFQCLRPGVDDGKP